ncbi:hypothetical protein HYX04_03380 [Candidatus Woesearchaeota archaeon]|nr:hypothetical protein [Candidatus Woesearchaeota archaeon]
MIELLIASQLNFGDIDARYISQNQKPPVYAQASSSVPNKDENLERMLAAYRNLVFNQKYNRRAMEMALGFYDDVIRDSKNNSHLAEAYLNSGIILCCMIDPKDLEKGVMRLEKAYAIGNDTMKLDAAYYLARLNYGYGTKGTPLFSFEKAKKYLTEIIKKSPGSQMAEEAKLMLLQIQKIKQ